MVYVMSNQLTDVQLLEARHLSLENLVYAEENNAEIDVAYYLHTVLVLDTEDMKRGRNFEGKPLMNDEGFSF